MTINTIFKDGFSLGMKNLLPLVGVVILYVLTCWIPYLNVGTTIALVCLPALMSRGEIISPAEIFDAKYRKNMGNYFLLVLFILFGTTIAGFSGYFLLLFLFAFADNETLVAIGILACSIPAIVLSYSWFIAPLLLVDKEINPLEALAESNTRTYDHKVTIFLSHLILGLLVGIVVYIGNELIPSLIDCGGDYWDYGNGACQKRLAVVYALFALAVMMFVVPIYMGFQAVVYRELTTDSAEVSASE